MELGKAFKQAVKFCAKPDDGVPSTYSSVRTVPAAMTGLNKAAIYVHNRGLGIRITVDQDVPNALLPMSQLLTMTKTLKPGHVITHIEDKGNARYVFTAKDKDGGEVKHNLMGDGPSEWDGFNVALPAVLDEMPYWWIVQKVIHAAHKDIEMLSNVKFTKRYVEATDKSRLARAEVEWPWRGLLPAKLFKNWPKGDVFVAFTEQAGFFQVDDELRFHHFLDGAFPQYPDCSTIVSPQHDGPEAVVPVKAFKEAVQSAVKVSPLDLVLLDFDMGQIAVRSFQEGEEPNFTSNIPVKANGGGQLLVNGKFLLDGLGEMETPNVRVCYGSPQDPLRLESGHHLECIWPMKLS